MNKINIVFSATVLVTAASLNALELPKFNVAVLNVTGIPLEVTYREKSHKRFTRVIAPTQAAVICSEELFLPLDPITFGGYGNLGSYLVEKTGLFPAMLRDKWRRVKKHDSEPLVIIVSSEGIMFPRTIKFEFSNKLPDATIKNYDTIRATGNPLAAFIRLSQYGLLPYLTQEQVFAIHSAELSAVLVPARPWELYPTSAEDVLRYILGLQKNYTEQDVRKAYANIKVEWHPKNIRTASQGFARDVRSLAEKAHDTLLEAIKDRSLSDEWHHIPHK